MSSKLWTAANALMLGMFILSTVVQFNDPDALRWVAIYATAAVLTALEIRRKAPFYIVVAELLIALVWSGAISRGVHGVPFGSLVEHWEMKDVRIEEAREMYGLLIVAVWMAAIAVAAWSRRRRVSATAGT